MFLKINKKITNDSYMTREDQVFYWRIYLKNILCYLLMNTISAILIILLTFSFVMPSNAKDLYKKNLGIKKSDTTLQGWGEWRVTGKKQLKKYEKKK